MNPLNYFKTTVILVILTVISLNQALAQTANFPEPRQEKLLNGLKLLIWNEPKSDKVTVKLRIHNGAAFDPKDKMGVMALLSDILFPTEESKAFFSEDLGGSLEVSANYDYLQITASGKADEVQTILETLATAVTNPPITQENFLLVRNARLEKIKALEKNPSYVADQAIAKRLFGDFPYGRSAEGTPESLAKIDKVDLMQARDRFFTADNATLAVIGNVKPDFIYRATRQLFGAWKKSESEIPATFRQPDAPDAKILFIDSPNNETAEIRFAVRGLARNDKDFYASTIWADYAQARLRSFIGENAKLGVQTNAHLLPGILIFKVTAPAGDVSKLIPNLQNGIKKMLGEKFKAADFAAYQANWMNEKKNLAEPLILADFWLDADTYKLAPVREQIRARDSITASAPEQIASRLLANAPLTIVVVGKADTLKAEVDKLNEVSKNH